MMKQHPFVSFVIGSVVLAACTNLFADEPVPGVTVDAKLKTNEKEWKPRPTKLLEHLPGFDAKANAVPTGTYGGRSDRRVDGATGYFQARQIDGRWWFVDPEGYLFYSVGMVSVSTNNTDNGKTALAKKFGTPEKWAVATAGQLRDLGFNTLGCWSSHDAFRGPAQMPYTVQLNFASRYGTSKGVTYQKAGHKGYPNDCVPVFDPEFAAYCDDVAERVAGPLKNDPWLIGYFTDNELPFRRNALERYLQLPPEDHGYQAAKKWVERNGGVADNGKFMRHLADTYYGTVSRALKKADANHLNLGSRLHGPVLNNEDAFRAMGPHVDVVSINYYNAWSPDAACMKQWAEWAGKPFVITEWYAKGEDSGMGNVSGAGWLVKTQADRGRFYQNFAIGLSADPGCVGWHWFKYIDNDPTNTTADPSNRDSNKGIVTSTYEPYEPLMRAMSDLNARVYGLLDYQDARRKD